MILSAFLLGLMGSLHCVGMCGPIMFSLPKVENSKRTEFLDGLKYHLGRSFGYGIVGILMGIIGSLLSFYFVQQVVSISLGVLIIGYMVYKTFQKKSKVSKYESYIISRLSHQLKGRSKFSLGFMNAFLPCGLTFLALASAIAVGDLLNSFIFMFFFGLGTAPAMLFMFLSANRISFTIKRKFKQLLPVFTICLGVLFILRGLNLGIPYISPKFSNELTIETFVADPNELDCH